jgi:hypothetical protein
VILTGWSTRREGEEAEGHCCLDVAFSFFSFLVGTSRQSVKNPVSRS